MEHMIVSIGDMASGQEALLKVQENDMKLQRILRKQAREELQMQNDTMKATAEATISSAEATAVGDYVQAGSEAAQALVNGANTVGDGYLGRKMNQANAPSIEKLDNATKFETKMQEGLAATRQAGDTGTETPLSDDHQTRLDQLVNGEAPIKLQPNDEEIIAHVQKKPEMQTKLAKRIRSAKKSAEKEQQKNSSDTQRTQQRLSTGFNIFNNLAQSTGAGLKGTFSDRRRGYADAAKEQAQTAAQNIQTALGQFNDEASSFEQAANQINQARQALADGLRG